MLIGAKLLLTVKSGKFLVTIAIGNPRSYLSYLIKSPTVSDDTLTLIKETPVARSDLPFGSEFSPSQIKLPDLLEMANEHVPNWKTFENAVRRRYFSKHSTTEKNRQKLANNTMLAMRSYGLINTNDEEFSLTEIGQALYELREEDVRLYESFARHILENRNGMIFVQCILDMEAAGETINLVRLRKWLIDYGIKLPRGNKNMSTMRLWLEKAGVFISRYRVDQTRIRQIIGIGIEELEVLATFSSEQRAYVRALANMEGGGPHSSREVERLATCTYGVTFSEKNVAKQVLYPLRDAEYISLERGTKEPGRGAKPFLVTATDKLASDVVNPMIQQIEQQVQPGLRPLLRKPLKEIREEMDSVNTHVRGLALEALAFKLMRLIDLTYVDTRLRGTATGGAEVDLVFESARLVFSRWQIQCKNTSRVSLDDVA